MQRRMVNKEDSEMAVFSKCRDLITYTLQMTNNTKRFPKSMRFTLVNRMQDKVISLYEAKWYGRTIVKINRFFPSSQLCHVCGHRDGKKALEIREWTCPACHTPLDRDVNASRNILAEGLRLFEATQP